jgi:peptide/nickel transport system permease protein
VLISSFVAIIIGCIAGYFGGKIDVLLMRVTEIFSAIPFLPFAMLLSYVLMYTTTDETTRILIIMVILGLLSWTGLARMIRGQVLAEREKEFVLAAKSMGIKEKRIAFKHILPNVVSILLVNVTLDFAGCMLTESSLSYLGFGVQQPQPTWGNMLYGANNSIVIQNYWWQWVFPALFLAIATISINIIGDTMRDVLDPKSSQER